MVKNYSDNPTIEAAAHISKRLKTFKNQSVLLLLSGGSALKILEHIDPFSLGENLTCLMGDERFSNNPETNNYLQLTKTTFFTHLEKSGASIISTVPDITKVTPTEYATAIARTIDYYLKTHSDGRIIALLGMGEDGHTAGIFPKTSKAEYSGVYRTDELYIAVDRPDRLAGTTITPYFIKKYINEVILYATGERKCAGAIFDFEEGSRPEFELPIMTLSGHPNVVFFTDCK